MPLRDELTLHEGPRTRDGAPTWTLHDPVTNRFFRIGWLEFPGMSDEVRGATDAVPSVLAGLGHRVERIDADPAASFDEARQLTAGIGSASDPFIPRERPGRP